MPVRNSSNNRVLPANARASDVASRAVQEILPAQQQRNYSAHRVQGFEVILYNRLNQGRKCSCQSSEKKLATRLGQDGKAKPGVVNELLSGVLRFDVTPYGSPIEVQTDPFASQTSPKAPVNKNQGVFDIVEHEINGLPSDIVLEDAFGDNGPLSNLTIDDMAGDFDASHMGFTDATCAVCFGSGFVGGYAPFHAHRIVQSVDDVRLGDSTINILDKPWSAESQQFTFDVVFPYGAIGVDIFRVLNNSKQLGANFTVDGTPINAVSVLSYCDGRPHTVGIQFADPTKWTHVEIQFVLSNQSAFFEFPKLNKSSDTALLERTEPFQISISSNVQQLETEDIIVDTEYGKALIIQTTNPWNSRNKDILGWECTVRPVQPMELYNILPRRGRTTTKPPAALGVHDNQLGTART